MKLNLQLLDRRPEEWKLGMLGVQPRRHVDRSVGIESGSNHDVNGIDARKRKLGNGEDLSNGADGEVALPEEAEDKAKGGKDEIDDLFAGVEKKSKRKKKDV
jgi:hypothetical protein